MKIGIDASGVWLNSDPILFYSLVNHLQSSTKLPEQYLLSRCLSYLSSSCLFLLLGNLLPPVFRSVQ